MAGANPLLAGEDGPVVIVNETGRSAMLLVCEHAGRRIPKALGTLGLPASELDRHIAWDIGADGLARRLSELLDAPLVLQRYSRLVYDCNRPLESPGAMPVMSESTPIPGNEDLTVEQRQARTEALYRPFHAAVTRLIEAREAPVLVTVHSFTPVYKGTPRTLDLGILHDDDARLADRLLRACEAEPDIAVRRNEPYGPQDGVTHTLQLHALPRGLENVMLEVRNDLIADEAGQQRMADRLAPLLAQAVKNHKPL
ncbi:MAG TPA: N-formylglutamate amidohydrolase [Aestuariivirgaceae bacterium]|nr:N-formylglutamate amidohydrolase [Aestuariivirgaceae bacterium]